MASRLMLLVLIAFAFLQLAYSQVASTSIAPSSSGAPPPTSAAPTSSRASTRASTRASNSSTTRTSSSSDSTGSTPPDVLLNVPNLSVGRIELDVDNLKADINLNAEVAGLVKINAGVALSIQQVNLTITDVEAQLELIVRLGHLVDIVNRVFESLDLNPLLINVLNGVTDIVDTVVGAVDGLLGSITQGGTTLNFLVDNLGNIVQEVGGVSSIVGNYLSNMTDTGESKSLSNGNTQKTYSYSPLNALVDIVFNTAGQLVQATVQKKSGSGGSTSSTSSRSTAVPSSTAAPSSTAVPASTNVATSTSA
ncbi:hypothetical protein HYFRA_00000647 [Hymenoscyphus fraxineus]|uniref:Uncharacterized protein n=1 Tax=Hymenoscyphus fraxineus TaxID=746836 RepID=A0A9N9L682_9HELO|nr:hypothetical protein HYFRA_00000647 [Hymenoscyphus fraxineus]